MTAPVAPLLLIGLGNTTRSDDGVGWYVASQVEERGRPGVEVCCRQQLHFEDAADWVNRREVWIVDASCEPLTEEGVRAVPSSHDAAPETIAALAGKLYGRVPQWRVWSIPGRSFAFGTELTPEVRVRADGVVEEMLRAIDGWRSESRSDETSRGCGVS